MSLRVEDITLKRKDKREIKKIYISSFTKEERMPFWLMIIMKKINNTEFKSFHDKDTLCGFVYIATIESLTFIIFLAVDENIRSKGYGGKILDKIQSMYPNNKIILSIDRCDEDAEDINQRIRRKKFYINNGYVDTGYLMKLGNKSQEVLIKNGQFDELELLAFFKKYSNGRMKPKIWRKNS